MAVPLRLKVYKGEELVATRDFDRDMIKIGRLATAHLCLDDEKASRIHSVLNVEGDGKLSIVDMGSVEGTYLNGKRVNKGTVQFGDEVRIGATRIIVEKGDPSLAAPQPTGPGHETTAVANLSDPNVLSSSAPTVAFTPIAAPPTMQVPVMSAPQAVISQPTPMPQPVPLAQMAPAAVGSAAVAYAPAPEQQWEPTLAPPEEGRGREFHLTEKAFGSYVPQKPQPRRPAKGGDLGLQIRYYWGDQLLHVSQHRSPRAVYVGSTKRSEMRIDAEQLGVGEFALVTPSGDGFALNLAPGMVGELDRDGVPTKITQGTHDLRAPDFAWVDLGGVRAEVSFNQHPKKIVVPISESIDYKFINLFLLLAFVTAAFVITASTHTEADVMADDLSSNKLVVAKFLIREAERPKKNALLDKLDQVKDPQPGESAERHKGDEGKMGKKDMAPNKTNRSAPKAIDINAKDLVKNSGLLKTLGSGGGGGLSTIFGQGGLGGDIKGAIGNMFGPRVGDAGGFGGLGLKGTGTGGGGMGNTIGIGGIGTHGRGGGISNYGMGAGTLDPKKKVDVGITSEPETMGGSLDKELIRQVIRRNIGQIRYCYESELQTKPNLAGKVAIRFIILPNGDVQTAKATEASTLNEARLSECICSRVHSWKFPSPKGGGSVIVTYPFILKPAGD